MVMAGVNREDNRLSMLPGLALLLQDHDIGSVARGLPGDGAPDDAGADHDYPGA